MAETFVKAIRAPEGFDLIKKSRNAFILLYVIAQRARRTKDEVNGLDIGEAMIGDYKEYGLTRMNYRSAIALLVRHHYVTIKATNKGTIAKIIDKSIYDINIDEDNQQKNHEVTIDQPSSNHQVTTNKNVKKNKNVKNVEEKALVQISFERFWQIYPRKIAKADALKRWKLINPTEELVTAIVKAVSSQIEAGMLNTTEIRYCPHPTTWLNQHRWEDEIVQHVKMTPKEESLQALKEWYDSTDEDGRVIK